MTKFLIAAKMRSGTHFLKSVLGSHPAIHCCNEVLPALGPDQFHSYLLERIREDENCILPQNKPGLFNDYLTDLFSRFPGKQAVGVDIKYYQYPWIPGIFQILNMHHIKVIHVKRKHMLKHLVSIYLHMNRQKLGRAMHGTSQVAPVKAVLNANLLSDLEELKRETDNFTKIFSENFPCLELCYEDFFDDHMAESDTVKRSVLNRIYDFLDIPERRFDLKSNLRKTNLAILKELIDNYDEVAGFLMGTQWEYLLSDTVP